MQLHTQLTKRVKKKKGRQYAKVPLDFQILTAL